MRNWRKFKEENMKKSKKLRLAKLALVLTCILLAMTALAGCGSADSGGDAGSTAGGGTSSDAPEFIKIGIPNPSTGPISTFGIGTPWAEDLVVDYVNNELGGIYIA